MNEMFQVGTKFINFYNNKNALIQRKPLDAFSRKSLKTEK